MNREKLENLFFSATLYLLDHADYLESAIFEDDENIEEDEIQSPEEIALSVIKEAGLSIEQLEGSGAIIHNIDKKLYVFFEENNKVYRATILEEFDEFGDFIAAVKYFDEPRKVRISEVVPNSGGWIDTHYGFKFKIEFLDSHVKGLENMVIGLEN